MNKEKAYEVYKIYSEISEVESLLNSLERNPDRVWSIKFNGISDEFIIPRNLKENIKDAIKSGIDYLKNELERY